MLFPLLLRHKLPNVLQMYATPNRLKDEVSPYLLQHSNNPIDWYPWGNEAFERAKVENKLLFISIGYSSCHWCHVMNNEAFHDIDIATLLNKNFICILVDKEERPDVDELYMNVAQLINGRSGWPLNFFALPDSRPIYGEIYLQKEELLTIASNLFEKWIINPLQVYEIANSIENEIYNDNIIRETSPQKKYKLDDILNSIALSLSKNIDNVNGGLKGKPKFPMPGLHLFLLIYSHHSAKHQFNEFIYKSLTNISNGGIFDSVGGGFFRYTLDEQWKFPHFEKMLYDNTQLLRVYATAYRVDPQARYRLIVEQTIEFMTREMHNVNGGFFCSIDADTAEGEGAYYLWDKEEIDDITGADAELISAAFGITPIGNYNDSNILHKCMTNYQLSTVFDIPFDEVNSRIDNGLKKILATRNKRPAPNIDFKIITSWNALAITGLTSAYKTLQNPEYKRLAIETANFTINNNFVNNTLYRITCQKKTYGEAFLNDYAYLVQACIELYSITFEKSWLKHAKHIADKAIDKFFDKGTNLFYFTGQNTELFARKMNLIDGSAPSGNVIMASSLYKLGSILEIEEYLFIAKRMLKSVCGNINVSGIYIYAWAQHIFEQISPIIFIRFNLSHRNDILFIQSKVIHPNLVLIECEKQEKIQLCTDEACILLTNNPNEIINAINKMHINN